MSGSYKHEAYEGKFGSNSLNYGLEKRRPGLHLLFIPMGLETRR